MSPELDALLCQRYPQIFADRHASMQTTCMCWGFSCGDGWFQLIDTLCANLQRMTDEDGAPQIIAVQVKEKFGVLTVSINDRSDDVLAIFDKYARRSAAICIVCGKPLHYSEDETRAVLQLFKCVVCTDCKPKFGNRTLYG